MDCADGVVLFGAGAGWAPVLVGCGASAGCLGVRCGWQRAELQSVGVGSAPPAVRVGGRVVDPVVGFAYLGSGVASGGFAAAGLHGRVGFAGGVLGRLGGV